LTLRARPARSHPRATPPRASAAVAPTHAPPRSSPNAERGVGAEGTRLAQELRPRSATIPTSQMAEKPSLTAPRGMLNLVPIYPLGVFEERRRRHVRHLFR